MSPNFRFLCAAISAVATLAAGESDSHLEPDAQGLADAMRKEDCGADDDSSSCDLSLLQIRARQAQSPGQTLLEESIFRKTPASRSAQAPSGSTEKGYHNHGARNVMTVYHQTSPSAGASILKGGFRRGTRHAICGSAIYFSPSVKDTDVKAMGGRGFIIQAQVDLGTQKWMKKDCDPHMTEEKLSSMGFDSITLDRGHYAECEHLTSCREYVIYDPRRVLSMKGWNYNGWKHWYGPYLNIGNETWNTDADADVDSNFANDEESGSGPVPVETEP